MQAKSFSRALTNLYKRFSISNGTQRSKIRTIYVLKISISCFPYKNGFQTLERIRVFEEN